MLRRPPLVVLCALTLLAAACGSDEGSDSAGSTPVPTIGGVGALPEVGSGDPLVMIGPPLNGDGTEAELVGDLVEGNRILLIGDSIMAGTARRYGNNMCNTLVPLGWEVDVEAEPSRFVDFGNRVLDRLLPDGVDEDDDYDAAVVFLGSNYGGDEEVYEQEMREILEHLEPRPTLLLTVTVYRRNYVEVNEVVRKLADEYDHVRLVDWQSVAETPGVLSSDRLHPTNEGRQVLADLIAASLGQVAVGEGDCLEPRFRDDSQATSGSGLGSSSSSNGDSSSSGGSSGGSSSSGGGVTTTATPTTTPAPVTTPAPSTTTPGSGGGSGAGPTTTQATDSGSGGGGGGGTGAGEAVDEPTG